MVCYFIVSLLSLWRVCHGYKVIDQLLWYNVLTHMRWRGVNDCHRLKMLLLLLPFPVFLWKVWPWSILFVLCTLCPRLKCLVLCFLKWKSWNKEKLIFTTLSNIKVLGGAGKRKENYILWHNFTNHLDCNTDNWCSMMMINKCYLLLLFKFHSLYSIKLERRMIKNGE